MLVPLLYLLSSIWTHSCYFPYTQSGYQITRSLKELGLWSTSRVGPCEVESTPEARSAFLLLLRLIYSFMLSSLYIWHYFMILPLICSYMWDLTSRAHI